MPPVAEEKSRRHQKPWELRGGDALRTSGVSRKMLRKIRDPMRNFTYSVRWCACGDSVRFVPAAPVGVASVFKSPNPLLPMISEFRFESSVVFNSNVNDPRSSAVDRPRGLQLPLWMPGELLNLRQVEPTVQAVLTHFAPLHLGWSYKVDKACGGVRVTAVLESDPVTGEVWELAVLQRSGMGRHRHNVGGLYGECVITLAGEMDDLLDDGTPVKLKAGAVMFHAVDTVHEARAEGFWTGLTHRPRGATPVA